MLEKKLDDLTVRDAAKLAVLWLVIGKPTVYALSKLANELAYETTFMRNISFKNYKSRERRRQEFNDWFETKAAESEATDNTNFNNGGYA